MEKKITPELVEAAKKVKSARELVALAKENGIEMSAEQAEDYFAQISAKGELNDDDLSDVAGGGCSVDPNRKIVMPDDVCDRWICKSCGGTLKKLWGTHIPKCRCGAADTACCGSCKYIVRESVICYCTNPSDLKL